MNGNTCYTASAEITLTNGTVLGVTPADVVLGGNRFTDGLRQDAFPVGAAMSRTMQLRLDNADGRWADADFFGAVIDLSLNYGDESAAVGRFTVRRPETCGETVILTAQDDMYKADRPFSSALTYPAAAGALWSEICTVCGITNGMQTIPSASYVIASAPSSDLTCRAVLGYIAMLSGGNARISRSGALEIVNYDFAALEAERAAGTAAGIHDLAMWRSLRLDREDVNITGVRTTVYDGEQSRDVLVGCEGYVLTLENPLFAGRERDALAGIAAALGMVCPGAGVFPGAALFPGQSAGTFRGFSGEYIAYPLAEFGDGARLTDRRGSNFYTVVTDVDFRWSGPTLLECRAESAMRNAARYFSPDVHTLGRSAQMIQNAVRALGGMYETTEQAAGGGTVYYLHDRPALDASGIVLKLTAESLDISTDGGASFPTGWNFATGTAVTNILQSVGINADWITSGAVTVTDNGGHTLFCADKSSQIVLIGGFGVSPSGLGKFTDIQNYIKVELGNGGLYIGEDEMGPFGGERSGSIDMGGNARFYSLHVNGTDVMTAIGGLRNATYPNG